MPGATFESKRCAHYVGCRTDQDFELAVIVILALVALFIGLRLYAVLGERTGHEQPILKPADPDARISQPQPAAPREAAKTPEAGDLAYLPMAGPGVRALLGSDPSFDVSRFLEGAGGAYRLVLESFWKGDLDTIKPHVAAHIYEAFAAAVEQREKDGHKLDNRLVALEPPVITEAEVDNGAAVITVRFEADIAAVTRNADGEVVAGSMSDAVQTRDRWTFRRDITSRDPNWLLIETDEEE
jgi:predicted lipid-binding transport protein (Tim44 family)